MSAQMMLNINGGVADLVMADTLSSEPAVLDWAGVDTATVTRRAAASRHGSVFLASSLQGAAVVVKAPSHPYRAVFANMVGRAAGLRPPRLRLVTRGDREHQNVISAIERLAGDPDLNGGCNVF